MGWQDFEVKDFRHDVRDAVVLLVLGALCAVALFCF